MRTHALVHVAVPLLFLMTIIGGSITFQVSAFGCTLYHNKPAQSMSSYSCLLLAASRDRDHDVRMVRDDMDYIDRGSYWVFMFYLLMVFQQREGHVHVSLSHVEQGWPLGGWLGHQRVLVKRHQLDPTRQDRLAQAGVVWDLNNQHWLDMYHLLLTFHQHHGHSHVPQQYQVANTSIQSNKNTNLGWWLSTQRAAFRKGTLLPHRRQCLEALGVAWNQQTAQWETMYQLLQQFHARQGHAKVPLSHVEAGQPLGTWMATQRKHLKRGTMSAHRRDRLQALLLDHTSIGSAGHQS